MTKNTETQQNNNEESLGKKMDVMIKLLAMNMIKELKTDKEKVQFLHNQIGLESSTVAQILGKTTKELSQYLYAKKSSK